MGRCKESVREGICGEGESEGEEVMTEQGDKGKSN